MNVPHKDSRSRLEELKNQVKERLSRPTLVEDLTKQSQQKTAKNMGWVLKEIQDDPGGSLLLLVSSLFTAMLGLYLGLTPHLVANPDGSQDINFNTDAGHVITAILYVASLVIVTEIAFFYSRHKYHTREEGNGHQLWTMWIAMALAFVSIVVTGGSGGTVVASTLGFLTEFKEVPPSLQKYLVWIIPSLFGFFLVLHTIYRLTSQKARAERIAQQVREQQELEHRMLMEQLELEGEEEIMIEEIDAYRELVRRGKLSRGQALAARRAGKSIPELEKELGQDLNDDGSIGAVRPALPDFRPAPKLESTKVYRRRPENFRAKVDYPLGGRMIKDGSTYMAVENEDGDYVISDDKFRFGVVDRETLDFIKRGFPDEPAGPDGPDWNLVNQKLEDLKQDLLRASNMVKNGKNGQHPENFR